MAEFRYTDEEPVYGLRVRVPAPRLSALVHLVSPMMQMPVFGVPPDTEVLPFTGKYWTCIGILDGNIFEAQYGPWQTWTLPDDTLLTCLQCIRQEDIERGRR